MTPGVQLTLGAWAVGAEGCGLGDGNGGCAGDCEGDTAVVGAAADAVAAAAVGEGAGDEVEATGVLRAQAAISITVARATILTARITVPTLLR